MLEAHLNKEWDAATRNLAFVNQSIHWFTNIAPCNTYKYVLDLGCGPGIYANLLNEQGYHVTGIDFSKRSIEYAKTTNQNNTYIYQNYLDIDYENQFDLVLLIYCDYAVLSPDDRMILLNKIYRSLKKGGKFIFDVFTPNQYNDKMESSHWYLNEGPGFYKATSHICLEAHYIYENNIRLNQIVVIDDHEQVDVYRIWDQFYTKDSILNEISPIGFKTYQIYSDVSGTPYNEESKTLCIVLEK